MNGRQGQSQQLLPLVPQHAAGLGVGIDDLVLLRIDEEDRLVGVLEYLAEAVLTLAHGLLGSLAVRDVAGVDADQIAPGNEGDLLLVHEVAHFHLAQEGFFAALGQAVGDGAEPVQQAMSESPALQIRKALQGNRVEVGHHAGQVGLHHGVRILLRKGGQPRQSGPVLILVPHGQFPLGMGDH